MRRLPLSSVNRRAGRPLHRLQNVKRGRQRADLRAARSDARGVETCAMRKGAASMPMPSQSGSALSPIAGGRSRWLKEASRPSSTKIKTPALLPKAPTRGPYRMRTENGQGPHHSRRDRGARCLIPWFDGAIRSLEWKEAIWNRYVTGAPRPRTPSEQQYSDRKLRSRR